MSKTFDTANVPQSEIFWGALPAITRASLAWRGECGGHFGIYLINFWTAEPGQERELWSRGSTIQFFVREALEKHTANPWEKACVDRILEIGVISFAPAKTTTVGIARQSTLC